MKDVDNHLLALQEAVREELAGADRDGASGILQRRKEQGNVSIGSGLGWRACMVVRRLALPSLN